MDEQKPFSSDQLIRDLVSFLNEMRDNAVDNAKHINKLYDHVENIEHRLKRLEQKISEGH